MFKIIPKIKKLFRDVSKSYTATAAGRNIKSYYPILEKIEHICFNSADDCQLKNAVMALRRQAMKGVAAEILLPEAFALVREASRRVTGMRPFPVQIIAGIVLYEGKIAEMQTGEGKTLSAVMPAFLKALSGKGVHILTFNDYLAARDAAWMGPIYEFLGLSVGCIQEGMSACDRKKAYAADITYVSAKEAGFDYLRDAISQTEQDLVHRPLHYAIIDEADSILIDEARIPLVIAGNIGGYRDDLTELAGLIKRLRAFTDYELNQNGDNVFLTDVGLQRVEDLLGRGNLYDPENLVLLARVNCALHAETLLKRDADYIVRNDRIEIVDKHTGRIADKRHWPDELQAAVEAKEGIVSEEKGRILGSIALQHYLSLYEKIAGMTGTAATSADEFGQFYGMEVVVIPSNKPCIRKDLPDVIFTHQEAKRKALLEEIKLSHDQDRPVLIGTGSVAESERLAADLNDLGINCRLLNAKNDVMEAKIIARAGEPGAVTVSTNMAGRGVDIKLGGAFEKEKMRVVQAGGLYVMGTSLSESRRVNNQLRGRAGRQGDPGGSRFYISLDDTLIRDFNLDRYIPSANYPQNQEEPVRDPIVSRNITRGIKMIEGYHEDIRKQLWEYAAITEDLRRIIHARREKILKNEVMADLLAARVPERYQLMRERVGEKALQLAEKQLTLHCIDKCWANYLEHISYIRESIHLVALGKKNPLTEFYRSAREAYMEMLNEIDSEIIRLFSVVDIDDNGIVSADDVLKVPSATWTYLLNESPDLFTKLGRFLKSTAKAKV